MTYCAGLALYHLQSEPKTSCMRTLLLQMHSLYTLRLLYNIPLQEICGETFFKLTSFSKNVMF